MLNIFRGVKKLGSPRPYWDEVIGTESREAASALMYSLEQMLTGWLTHILRLIAPSTGQMQKRGGVLGSNADRWCMPQTRRDARGEYQLWRPPYAAQLYSLDVFTELLWVSPGPKLLLETTRFRLLARLQQ